MKSGLLFWMSCLCSFIIGEVHGAEQVWFIGDNFAARSLCKYFLLVNDCDDLTDKKENEPCTSTGNSGKFFLTEHYEVKVFCNSKFSSATTNLLVCLQNTFVAAINKNKLLPKYIILVLDDDLIKYLNFSGPSVSQLLGNWLEWLTKQFTQAVYNRKKVLPTKAKNSTSPCIYWCLAPGHSCFSLSNNELCKKHNLCLETLLRGRSDMWVIKMKDHWNFQDSTLVKSDSISESGLYAYWGGVDAAFKLNALRHEMFLAKSKCAKTNGGNEELVVLKEERGADVCTVKTLRSVQCNETRTEDKFFSKEDIPNFFRRHRQDGYDRFHWQQRRGGRPYPCNDSRFLLPRLKSRQ